MIIQNSFFRHLRLRFVEVKKEKYSIQSRIPFLINVQNL
jgi:hypothetical protein